MVRGEVALVTGGSRGIGKGIAKQLVLAGATVYITGRTILSTSTAPGTLKAAGEEINEAAAAHNGSGKCIAVACDHTDDVAVEALFRRIVRETGKLSILVNNAYGGVNALMDSAQQKFWEKDLSIWDASNEVGLRSHYIASVFASRIMVKAQTGLIVNISSMGGLRYAKFAGDVAYGVGKAAGDRLINDMAHELKPHNVAAISLWPGAVNTEMTMARVEGGNGFGPNAESPEFAGASIVALYNDPNLMKKTGKVCLTTELAVELDFTDIDGRVPSSHPPGLRKVMNREVPLQWKLDAAL